MNFPLVGGDFTWSNNRDSQSWSKINRFLLSPEREEQFLNVSQMRLTRIPSDHFPLMLDCIVLGRGSRFLSLKICG